MFVGQGTIRSMTWKKTLLLVGIAALIGYGAVRRFGRTTLTEYRTSRVERGEIGATVSATGKCNAVVTVQVGSQVSGNIAELFADYNTQVSKGQLVAPIDPALFESRLNQSQANMDVAQSSVVNAQAQVRRAESDIASAQAQLENQRANIVKARVSMQDSLSKFNNTHNLFERGIVSGEEHDTARATHETAEATHEASLAQARAAEFAVKAAEAGRDVALTQLNSAKAQARQAQAGVEQARIDLEHTKIYAPVDGVVIARQMDVGQTVAASFNAPTIFEIAQDLTQMHVEAHIDEADVGLVKESQPATFTVDAYPNETFAGEVSQIRRSPNVVQNVVTYDVIVNVANDDLKLLPGMTASVRILVDKRGDVLKLPNAALRVRVSDLKLTKEELVAAGLTPTGEWRTDGDAAEGGEAVDAAEAAGSAKIAGQLPPRTVWKKGADGRPRPVKIRPGIFDNNFTEIVEVTQGELGGGEEVIVGVKTPLDGGVEY
jgi:HlyD family secretion protein